MMAEAIYGDHGLGLCLTCLFDYKKAARDRAAAKQSSLPARQPRYAIALVPAPAPVPGPRGTIAGLTMVAVGACYDHIGVAEPSLLLGPDGSHHAR